MKKRYYFLLLLIFLIILSLWGISFLPDGKLHLYFVDVGQGDGILMQLPTGEFILNDGGPDNKIINFLSQKIPFYNKKIDLVIMSHPHADHLNGLIEVLKRYEVKNLMLTGVKYNYLGYDQLIELALDKNVNLIYVDGQKDYKFGKVAIDILYPNENINGKYFANVNNSSIAFRLIFNDFKAFFSGDLEKEKEELLISQKLHLNSDILKAGHHGSKTSNNLFILEKIRPDWVIISCGVNNKFNHPNPETLKHLQSISQKVFRTDLQGNIEVQLSSKDEIAFKPSR